MLNILELKYEDGICHNSVYSKLKVCLSRRKIKENE